jgi:hypothetical protein
MGSKPKKSEYKPTEAEKTSAAVAMAEYKTFKKKYDPLLQKMRDQSKSDDPQKILRGRANADTMQALTENQTYRGTQANDLSSDMSKAYLGQMGQATAQGLGIQNQAKTNVLGIARKQAGDAQSGMAQASRLATSEALTRAKAKQDVRAAKAAAIGEIAGSAMSAASGNNASGTNAFGDGKFGDFMKNFSKNVNG